MKIYGHPLSSSTRKVLFALAEKNASLSMIGAEHTTADCPHLKSWWERVTARPSWTRMMARSAEKKPT